MAIAPVTTAIRPAARISAPGVAQILAGAATAKPAMARDSSTLKSAPPISVVTFNTAVGNPKIKTPQTAFKDLPFYQKIINGDADAPIFCGQEIGPTQAKQMKELARSGNFTVISTFPRPWQGNMILLPKRFEVLKSESHGFGVKNVIGFAKGMWGWLTGKGKPEIGQLLEPRHYTEVKVRDKASGKEFTLFNTHISYFGSMKSEQADILFKRVHEAMKEGPVILAGDLNTHTPETVNKNDPYHADEHVHGLMDGLADMGLPGKPGARSNIDWVLGSGFEGVSSKWYVGNDLALPGSPNAELVSDHYAEEDVLRFTE